MAEISQTKESKTKMTKESSGDKPTKRGRKPALKSVKSRKTKKHLTDKEYEEIFKAAINTCCFVDKKETEDSEDVKLNKKSDILKNDSAESTLPNYFDALEDLIQPKASNKDEENLQVVPEGEIDLFPVEHEEQEQIVAQIDPSNNNIAENNLVDNDLQCLQAIDQITPDVSDSEVHSSKVLPPPPKVSRKRIGLKKKRPASSRKQLKYNSDVAKSSSESADTQVNSNNKKTIETKNPRGVWVECINCNTWRFVKSVSDTSQISDEWNCSMNTDFNICIADKSRNNLKKIGMGSVVLAKIRGYPWWPAIVDNDPIDNKFFLIDKNTNVPTHYHVIFIDDGGSRAWIHRRDIKKFAAGETQKNLVLNGHNYAKEIKKAEGKAAAALQMDFNSRIEKFGIINFCNEDDEMVQKENDAHAVNSILPNNDAKELKPVAKKRQRTASTKTSGRKKMKRDVNTEPEVKQGGEITAVEQVKTKQGKKLRKTATEKNVGKGKKVKPCLVKRQNGGNFEIISPYPYNQTNEVVAKMDTEEQIDVDNNIKPVEVASPNVEVDSHQTEKTEPNASSKMLTAQEIPSNDGTENFLNVYGTYLQAQADTEIVSNQSDIIATFDNESPLQPSPNSPFYDNLFLTPKEDSQANCGNRANSASQGNADTPVDGHNSSPFHLDLSASTSDDVLNGDVPPPLEIEE